MSGYFKKMAAKSAAGIRNYWAIIAGAGAYHILSWIFDNPVWMAVELKWQETGVIAMMIIAFFLNVGLLAYFKNKKSQWLLWTALDELSEKRSKFNQAYDNWGKKRNPWRFLVLLVTYIPVKLAMLLLWCLNKSPRLGDLAAFLILPIIEDPFITTMYLKHGYRNGLRGKDYLVFFGSSIYSIGYWALRNAAFVEFGIRPLIKLFQ